MTAAPVRIVAIADTDSYVKWAASLIGARSDAVDGRLFVLETPLVVSAIQQAAAVHGSGLTATRVARISFEELRGGLVDAEPDAVLLAARGPLVRVLAREIARWLPDVVIVTGLPGISYPATRKALVYRAQCDLFVLHSHREVRAFADLAAECGYVPRLALARLPFARRWEAEGSPGGAQESDATATDRAGGDLVFAAQALVPRERGERRALAAMLIEAARADPARRVVLKIRAVKGESQTHAERAALHDLIDERGERPANLVVSAAPMAQALETAAGLVTVSSTAVVEAIACGVPAIVLDTFGVAPELINTVFVGSGLFGSAQDVIAGAYRHPDPSWLRDNYFHPPENDDWMPTLASLVVRRRAGALPPRSPWQRRGGALRDAWERKNVLGRHDRSPAGVVALAIGVPARTAVRLGQRVTWSLRDGRRRRASS